VSAKAKPKQVHARTENSELLDDSKPTTGRKTGRARGDSSTLKQTGNEAPRRRNPAKKTTKKAKTANELMFEAWEYIWENRHRRLTKP
jgi:hypothetical protein